MACGIRGLALGQETFVEEPQQAYERIVNQQSNAQQGIRGLDQLPDSRSFSYTFNNVRVSTIEGYLKYAGIRLPIRLAGQLSGWVWAQNQGSFFSLADYAVELQLNSNLLLIENIPISNASVRLAYKDGNWTLRSVQGSLLTSPNAAAQDIVLSFNANGALPSGNDELANLTVTGSRVDATKLQSLLGIKDIDFDARGDFALRVQTRVESLSDFASWSGSGAILLKDIQQETLHDLDLNATVALRRNRVSVSRAWLENNSGDRVRFSGALQIDAPNQYSLDIPKQPFPIESFIRHSMFEDLEFTGLRLGGNVQGNLQPFTWQANIDGDSQQADIAGQLFGNLSAVGPITAKAIGPLQLNTRRGQGAINATYTLIDYSEKDVITSIKGTLSSINVNEFITPEREDTERNETG